MPAHMPLHMPVSRSRFLQFLFALLFLAFAGLTAAAPAQQKTQVPGYYRIMVGGFEVTALYDGYIDLDNQLLKNVAPKDLQRLLARMFISGQKVQTAVNAYLINTGKALVLVDTGAAKKFGPSLGYVADHLKAAGYQPSQVDAVLITHLHGDHVNGLLDAAGQPLFPNAQIWSAKADTDYWLNPEVAAKAPKEAQAFFQMAQQAAAPYQQSGRWKNFSADGEVVPGIKSLAAPGHTPGHSGFLVESAGRSLLIMGDIVHSYAVQFARPEVTIEFDVNAKLAEATRKKLFARAAQEKLLVAGMHLPFPGLGHVRAEKKAFAWVPVEFGPIRE